MDIMTLVKCNYGKTRMKAINHSITFPPLCNTTTRWYRYSSTGWTTIYGDNRAYRGAERTMTFGALDKQRGCWSKLGTPIKIKMNWWGNQSNKWIFKSQRFSQWPLKCCPTDSRVSTEPGAAKQSIHVVFNRKVSVCVACCHFKLLSRC